MSRLAPWISAIPLLVVVGCLLFVPPKEPRRTEPEPVGVTAEQVWRSPDVWKGQQVRILLLAHDYTTEGDWLYWCDGRPENRPAITFHCLHTLAGNSSTIQITGTCRGMIDGRVLIEDCKVHLIPARLP